MTGDEPPTDGDWVVEHNSTVRDESITLNGNLTVTNSSVLDLANVILRLNCTLPDEFSINVEAGSSLIADNTTFTRGGQHNYSFTFAGGSAGALNDTLIEYAGASSRMGLTLQSEAVSLTNSTIRESYNGVVVQSPARIASNTIYNTSVGLALANSDAGNDVEADNTFEHEDHGNTIANIRSYRPVTVVIQDQDGQGLEAARVYLNDTLGGNWVDSLTPADGRIGPISQVVWEVTPGGVNQSLEPFDLIATKHGRSNSTRVTPSNTTTLTLELKLLPDLAVEDSQILWGATPVSLTVVPSGRDNDTQFKYRIMDDPSQFPSGWYEPGFNDSAWNVSAAPFGDKDQAGTDLNTIWDSEGEDPYTKDHLLLRHRFTLPEGARVLDSALNVAFNNYCTPYLNGNKIYDERGSNTHSASYWNGDGDADVDPDHFTAGENVMAIYGRDYVYQSHGQNSQWLDFQLTAEYYIPGRGDLVVDYSTLIVTTVENRGVAAAQGVQVNLYNDSTLMETKTVDLGVGEQKNVFFDWTPGHNGTQVLTVEVDESQAIEEENETNNNASAEVFVGGYGINLTTDDNHTAITYNLSHQFNLTAFNYGDINDNVTLALTPMNDVTGWQTHLSPQLLEMEPQERLNTSLSIQPVRGAPVGNYSFIIAANSQFQSTGYTTLVPSHSDWRWLDTDNPPAGWEESDYNDSGWSEAPAPFGAGSNFEDEATEWGGNGWSSDDEAVFRLRFDLTRPIKEAVLKLAVADGARAYLNGVQVVDDLQGDNNDGSRGASHWDYITGEKPSGLAALDLGLLNIGENVLAIRVFDTGRANFFDAEFDVAYHSENTQELVVEILPTHDFDLGSYTDEFEHPTNTTQVYTINLHNYGHFNETIEAQLQVNDQQGDWTHNLSADNLTLEPGTGGSLTLEVFANESLTLEDYLDLTFTFQSQEAPWVNHTYDLFLWADPPHYEFELTDPSGDEEHTGGSTVYYPIEVTNSGNLNTTLKATYQVLDQSGNWTVGLAPAQLTLQEDEVGQFDLEVTGARDLRDWDHLNVSVTVYLDDHFELNETYLLNLTAVEADRGYSLHSDFENHSQLNNTVEVYSLTVTNLGSLDEIVLANVTILEQRGNWSVRLLDDSVDLAEGGTADVEIEVTAAPELRFWDYLNLSVEVTLEQGAWLRDSYVLNVTPIFDDHYPPETRLVPMGSWVRESNVTLEWEVIKDEFDTFYFQIHYQTEDPGGNTSEWGLWQTFNYTTTSATFPVQDGWSYYIYSLGQDAQGNLELDKKPLWDNHFTVDLEPPQTRLWLTDPELAVNKGTVTQTELGLEWAPVNHSSHADTDYTYTIEVRNRSADGAFGPWQPMVGLADTKVQNGDLEALDGHTYQFRSIATDPAGWVENKSGWDLQVAIDQTPPVTGILPLPAIRAETEVTLLLEYENKTDVAELEVQYTNFPEDTPPNEYVWLKGGTFQPGLQGLPDDLQFTKLSDGQRYLFRLIGTDAMGNVEPRDGVVEYYVGNQTPGQTHQLGKLPLPSPSTPYSKIKVEVDPDGDGDFEDTLVESLDSEIPTNSPNTFHLDYTTGVIHFGHGTAGFVPANGTQIRITYDAYDTGTLIDSVAPNAPGVFVRSEFNETDGSAELIWRISSSPDVVAYRVEWTTDLNGNWTAGPVVAAVYKSEVVGATLRGLPTDKTLYVRVVSVDRAGLESPANAFATVNEQAVEGEDDDDEGFDPTVMYALFLLSLVAFTVIGYMLMRRKDEPASPPGLEPPPPAGVSVIPAQEARVVAALEAHTVYKRPQGNPDELNCPDCGYYYTPTGEDEDPACPACGFQDSKVDAEEKGQDDGPTGDLDEDKESEKEPGTEPEKGTEQDKEDEEVPGTDSDDEKRGETEDLEGSDDASSEEPVPADSDEGATPPAEDAESKADSEDVEAPDKDTEQ